MSKYEAIIFDAYGTLFNLNKVERTAESMFPKTGKRLSEIIREKQIDYTWIRSLTGRYENFLCVTDDAVKYALEKLGLDASLDTRTRIVESYLNLPAYADVEETFPNVYKKWPLAIFSDGTPEMLATTARYSEIDKYLSSIMSVDRLKMYKPALPVYQIPEKTLKMDKSNLLFVAAHPWDIVGAKTYGYPTCWINRKKEPFDELSLTPDYEINAMNELTNVLSHI